MEKNNIKVPTMTELMEKGHDPINHPSYYCEGGIETIDFIEAKHLGFCLANAVKYITRAGKKSKDTEIEDLEKAVFYINRRIYEVRKEAEDTGGMSHEGN